MRFGSDYLVLDDILNVRSGGYWENGSTPENYEYLDFPSFDRYAMTAGLTLDFDPVSLTIGYAHIIQEDRETSEEYGKVFNHRPLAPCPDGPGCDGISGVVANAGKITSGFDILSVGLEARFPDWF